MIYTFPTTPMIATFTENINNSDNINNVILSLQDSAINFFSGFWIIKGKEILINVIYF